MTEAGSSKSKLLRSKMYWVGILYFSEGFPLGFFYDVFPVHFRQQGVELYEIGFISLLGLSWTLKFLWAPMIDHYRHHRRWMSSVNLLMAITLAWFAIYGDFGPWVWFAIGLFTLFSATNDIAIDGYTIEMLNRREMGIANGLRIGFYRVGMLAAGGALILSEYLGWYATYIASALLLGGLAVVVLKAPKEKSYQKNVYVNFLSELRNLLTHPIALASVLAFLVGVVWMVDQKLHWSEGSPYFWRISIVTAGTIFVIGLMIREFYGANSEQGTTSGSLSQGPMFGTLLEMLRRPYILPTILFILIFKLGDASMGFMVKPFWVDAGFSASQIGLVSVILGLVLSIAGGIAGGWITDRIGIFHGLWILGLFQALSNFAYALVATQFVTDGTVVEVLSSTQKILMYCASGFESFTGGLGTAAFLAFLMAIVNKQHSATEYALLSSVFALSRSVAGWAGGFGAHAMGFAPYFLLTFFLSFPAYLLLPWVTKMLRYAESQKDWHQQ